MIGDKEKVLTNDSWLLQPYLLRRLKADVGAQLQLPLKSGESLSRAIAIESLLIFLRVQNKCCSAS